MRRVLRWSHRLWLLPLLLLLWHGSVLIRAAEAKTWRIDRSVPAATPALRGLQLAVLTGTQTSQGLILRVGAFNNTLQPLSGSAPLAAGDISLTALDGGKDWRTTPTTITLTDLFGGGTLASRHLHCGVFTFPWGQGEARLEDMGSMILNVKGFVPMVLAFEGAKLITPVDWTAVEKRSPLNLEVKPKSEGLAIFPMRLHSLVVKEEALELTISFRNAARFPVTWKGKLNGNQAILFTPGGERLAPSSVSETLSDRIAPEGRVWASGEDNLGWVRFPLPHPHEGHALTFVMPGYDLVRLVYDAEKRAWLPGLRAQPADTAPSKADAVLAEEQGFQDLKDMFRQMERAMMQRERAAFLSHFRGAALEDQKLTWQGWQTAPVASMEIRIQDGQRVQPDEKGRLSDVPVEMTYRLNTLPDENEFITQMECDMRRNEAGEWQIEFIDYKHRTPFWVLGYTQTLHSDHFMVLHRAVEEDAKQAKLALKQLERAYERLQKMDLTLQPRYAVFAVSQKQDFQSLTDRSADKYAGVASLSYTLRKGKIEVINQALYLNDFSFFSLQRAWGKQDRQVTIQHELAHLALADLTRPWTPTWLKEGAAMHYAEQCDSFTRDVLKRTLRPEDSLTAISRLEHLGADTDDTVLLMVRYQLSGETVKWIVKRHGVEAMLKLYAAYAATVPGEWNAPAGEHSKREMANARLRVAKSVLEKQLGLTLEQLDAQVRLGVLK